jgi:hypothetical protein
LVCSAAVGYVDFCGRENETDPFDWKFEQEFSGSVERISFVCCKNNPCLQLGDEAAVCKY